MWERWGKKTTVADFEKEARVTVGLFGRTENISVEFSGEEAKVEGEVIIFPQMEQTLDLDFDTLATFRGWMDHESSILRFGDKKEYWKAQQESPYMADLLNIIEGLRCEREFMDEYHGTPRNFVTLAKQATETILDYEKEADKPNTADLIPAALGIYAREKYQGAWFYKQVKDLEDHLKNDVEEIENWAAEIDGLKSTKDSIKLARKIADKYGKDSKVNKAQARGMALPSGTLGKAIEGMVKETEDQIKVEKGAYANYRVLTTENDKFHDHSDLARDANFEKYMKVSEKLSGPATILRRRIELLVQAKRKVEWSPLKEQGKLDSKRLLQGYQGSPNVFKVRTDDSDLDTAISLVVDLSGSMGGGNKTRVAFESCILLAECLQKIGLPFEILGFNCNAGNRREAEDKLEKAKKRNDYAAPKRKKRVVYGRTEPMDIYGFKTFKDKLFDARAHIGALPACVRGNNADADSIWEAYLRLRRRPEKRKIMFVLSDGQPHCEGDTGAQWHQLGKVVKNIAKEGTDIVGIGICDDSVSNFYPRYVVCNQADQLAGEVMKSLERALLPEKKRA